jgi:hypothetical protein
LNFSEASKKNVKNNKNIPLNIITNQNQVNSIERGLPLYLIDHILEYKATPIVITAFINVINIYPY